MVIVYIEPSHLASSEISYSHKRKKDLEMKLAFFILQHEKYHNNPIYYYYFLIKTSNETIIFFSTQR